MRILVVQNNRRAPVGLIGDELARRGAALATVRADEGEPLPGGPAGHAGLIVLGGPQDAWDDAQGPHFPRLMSLIRGFADAGRPVLGLCLGAQLIARAFGGRVYRNTRPEFGFTPVSLTPDAATDPLLAGVTGEPAVMQWHYDTFDLPAGAVRLAGNAAAENQAFRLGGHVHAFQFHLEADAAIIRGWIDHFGEEARETDPAVLADLAGQIEARLPAAERLARTVAGRWLDLAGQRAVA